MNITADVQHKLERNLDGAVIEVEDESHLHEGHGASGAHLFVRVKWDGFKDKSLLEQHRIVQDVLKEELEDKIHALHLKTEEA